MTVDHRNFEGSSETFLILTVRTEGDHLLGIVIFLSSHSFVLLLCTLLRSLGFTTTRSAETSELTNENLSERLEELLVRTYQVFMAFVLHSAPLPTKSTAREQKCAANVRMSLRIDRRACLQRAAALALALAIPTVPASQAAMYSADTKTDSFAPKGDLTKVEAYVLLISFSAVAVSVRALTISAFLCTDTCRKLRLATRRC